MWVKVTGFLTHDTSALTFSIHGILKYLVSTEVKGKGMVFPQRTELENWNSSHVFCRLIKESGLASMISHQKLCLLCVFVASM